MFPLELVQPLKRRNARIQPLCFHWNQSKPFHDCDQVNSCEPPLSYQVVVKQANLLVHKFTPDTALSGHQPAAEPNLAQAD